MSDIIHFAHGNGFPSSCYQQLLRRLSQDYQCIYLDRSGHSSKYPVTDNWQGLVDELIDNIEQHAVDKVYAVGHSLGGVLSFIAAVQRPDLILGVVMLDSPIISRVRSNLLQITKAIGLIDRVTPAYQTKNRKRCWESKAQALSYLRKKKLFQTFTEQCLYDYIDYGMTQSQAGLTLRFDPLIEYQIYRTLPHMLYKYEGKLTVPLWLITGSKSTVVTRADRDYMQAHFHAVVESVAGTHMYPFECPSHAAEKIIALLRRFN